MTREITFGPAVPILRIFDIEKAKEFYLGFLGFTWDWQFQFEDTSPVYAQVSRAGVVLHLSEHHGDSTPGSAIMIHAQGIADFHRELLDKKYRFARPGLETQPWNARTVTVTDPFANKITFSEPIETK